MSGKELTSCQQKAFALVKEYIKDKDRKEKHITINGRGGTGKTFLAKNIYDYAYKEGLAVIFAAPTHAARRELEKATGVEANTIHSILKISPTTHEDQSIFEQIQTPDLSGCDILICDEASMYDKSLFNIMMGSVDRRTLIIGMGDDEQFRPVSVGTNEFEDKSLFFKHPNFKQIELLENKRNGGALLDVCNDVREGSRIYQKHKDGTGVLVVDFNRFMEAYFKIVKTPEDFMFNRLVAYHNDTVDKLNEIIRQRIYKTTDPFILDEVIVLQEPVMKAVRYEGKNLKEIVYHNGENVKIKGIQETTRPITVRGVDETLNLRYYSLEVVSLDTGIHHGLNVLTDEKEKKKLSNFLNNQAIDYKSDSSKRRFWPDFWNLQSEFTKVKAIPASTVHKSQGSTFDNVFYIRDGIDRYDDQLVKQCDYVAITRAKKFAFVFK